MAESNDSLLNPEEDSLRLLGVQLEESGCQQSNDFQTSLSQARRSIEQMLTVLETRHNEEMAQLRASAVAEPEKPEKAAEAPSEAPSDLFARASLDEGVPMERRYSETRGSVSEGSRDSRGSDDTGGFNDLEQNEFIVHHLASFQAFGSGTDSEGSSVPDVQQTVSHQPSLKARLALSSAIQSLYGRFSRPASQTGSAPRHAQDLDVMKTTIHNVLEGPYSLLSRWSVIISELLGDSGSRPRDSFNFGNIMSADSIRSNVKKVRKNGCWQTLVLRPTSAKRFCWDMFSIVVVLYETAMLPMMIFEFEESYADQVLFWFTLAFWTQDILLSFCTGYQVEGTVEMRFKYIANRYIKGWLAVDLITVIPDWVLLFVSRGQGSNHVARLGKAAKVLRIIRSLRLLRIFRLLRAWHGLHEGLTNQYMASILEFVKLVLVLLFMSHYSACAWFGISKMKGQDGWVYEFELQSATQYNLYLTSLHWATSQLHSSADVTPGTNLERSYAIFYVFVALIAASVFVSSITNLTLRMQKLRQETFLKTHKLLCYLEQNHISSDLTSRIQSFARHATDLSAMRMHDVDLLKSLPPNLLTELHREIKTLAVNESYFLHKVVKLLPEGRRGNFFDEIHQATVSPGRHLFQNLEASGKMFILWKGKVLYHAKGMQHAEHSSRASTRQPNTEDTLEARSSGNHDFGGARSNHMFGEVRSLRHLPSGINFLHALSEMRGGNATVEGCRCISEMNLWTSWHHRGDCLISGYPTIFSIDAQRLGEMILANKFQNQENNLNIAFFLSNYAAHYIAWMRSVRQDELDDLSTCPHSRWKRLYSDIRGG